MPEVIMPKLSDTMTEGTLVAWKKKKGDSVEMGEVIAEVETDKATMEMEAFDEGTLTEIFVEEGDKVDVGTKIAFIAGEGEESGSDDSGEESTKGKEEKKEKKETSKKESKDQEEDKEEDKEAEGKSEDKPEKKSGGKTSKPSAPSGDGDKVKASPLARKMAKEKGVDLSGIKGSGPGGRIIRRDVEEAEGKAAPSSGKPQFAKIPLPDIPGKRVPLSGMRRVIAERLLQSKTEIPHFYLTVEVDAGPLQKLRTQLNEAGGEEGNRYSINDFILKAAVEATSKASEVNAAFDGDAIVEFESVNLAVAVAIDEGGLVTPVIRDAQDQSLKGISLAVKELAKKARSKKLKPEDYQGGTLTVSNLGAYGVDNFDAILNPPQACILSIGAVVKKPVVDKNDQIVVGQRMSVGMSCDHRVVDGAIAARYLAEVKNLIEHPALMLI